MSDVQVRTVDGALTRELRRTVLRPNLEPGDPMPGDGQAGIVHFAAIADDEAVLSTCMLFAEDCPWAPGTGWHLRQMATDPIARGRGLAGLVLNAVVDYIAERGGGVLWCNARELAVPMYQRAGLIGEGEIFTDEVHTIPHLRMWRTVDAANT